MKLYLPPSLLLGSLDKVQDKNDLQGVMSVRSYFCGLVLESKPFVTFSLNFCSSYYQKLSSEHEFTGNRLTDCHTLCKSVNEFLFILSACLDLFGWTSVWRICMHCHWAFFEFNENGRVKVMVCLIFFYILYIFQMIWVELSIWDVHNCSRSDCDFCKNDVYCPVWVKFHLIRDLHVMLVSICELYDNGDVGKAIPFLWA